MKRIINIITLLVLATGLPAQTTTENYIVTKTYTQADNSTAITQIQYYDGLGRPIETVMKAFTPLGKDLVSTTVYDGVGREWQQWLPAPSANSDGSFVNVESFKNTQKSAYGNDNRPFAQTNYEASPLNRVLGANKPGDAWATHPSTVQYGTNTSAIPYFYVDNTTKKLKRGTNYAANTLYETVTADEDGKQSTEYKDKLGQVVLKCNATDVFTAFVYNDLGQLSYVIPPKAYDVLKNAAIESTIEDDNDNLKKYGYLYKYDERGNCVMKRLPGCDSILMVYDKADRLVLSQDGNQRAKTQKQWTVTKYDALGRVVYTGTLNRNQSRTELKAILDPLIITESYNGSGTFANTGYTCNYFVGEITPILVNYYDDYSFLNLPFYASIKTALTYTARTGYGEQYTPPSGGRGATGLLTGTRVYMLNNNTKHITTALYYDDKGRVVQSRVKNYLDTYDHTYNAYTFDGRIDSTYIDHTGNFPEKYTYKYDTSGRLTETWHKYSVLPAVQIAKNSYDELCRLTTKKRHGETDTELFEYNIQGWLTKIISGTSNNFEQNLYYNTGLPTGSTACYNGNIASTTWKYIGVTKGYKYYYDNLNRLSNAIHNDNTGEYNEYFGYDKMGNIDYLERAGSNGTIDYLNFTYNGNQITAIMDDYTSQNSYAIKEYQDKAGDSQNEMAYDENGNLKKDLDRDIVTIRYNLLNLPDTIQFKNGNVIINHYSADGQKQRTDNYTRLTAITPVGENTVVNPENGYNDAIYSYTGTAYIGSFEYNIYKTKYQGYGGVWYYSDVFNPGKIYTPEGYIDYLSSSIVSTGVRYNYYRKDHLGNIREVWNGVRKNYSGVVKELASTRQRTQYYPSGLPWAESTGASVQKHKYNGKEFVEMHGLDEYDSEARWFYPAIMRTTTMDPHAENYYSISPYTWCGNNSVNMIDPDGMDVVSIEGGYRITGDDIYNYLGYLKIMDRGEGDKDNLMKSLQDASEKNNNRGGKIDNTLEEYNVWHFKSQGTISQMPKNIEFEFWLDEETDNYGIKALQAITATLYSFINSPAILFTGKSYAGIPITNWEDRVLPLVDVTTLGLTKGTTLLRPIIKNKGGLQGYNKFLKATKGKFKGSNWQEQASDAYKKNNYLLRTITDFSKAKTGLDLISNTNFNTKED
jgi:RHS repeat-associated protein